MKLINILLMHTHDSGRFLSPYGVGVPTDNLLNFAKDSIVFRQAYCASPTCSPSRAALLTGTYPHNNGMLGLAHRGFKITDYDKHLASYIRNYGYESVICGVQHEAGLWTNNDIAAKIIGYDRNITTDFKEIEGKDLVSWDLENAKRAAEYIKHSNKNKFFLSYGMFATHRGYPDKIDDLVDERYISLPDITIDNEENRKDTARYYTSAKHADECIQVVLNALKEEGLYDDTLIIFTTDHGIANPFNKCTLFDTGMEVSLIIRSPKQKQYGKIIDALVSQLDIFPTICDIVGIDKPEWLQGISLINLIEGKVNKVREEVFAEINYHTSYEPARAVRTNRYKYIKYYDDYNGINYSNIDDSPPKTFLLEKGLCGINKPMEALYDLYFDKYEKNNLINDLNYKVILEKLKKRLIEWQIETNDNIIDGPIQMPNEAKINKRECISAKSKNNNDYEQLPNKKM